MFEFISFGTAKLQLFLLIMIRMSGLVLEGPVSTSVSLTGTLRLGDGTIVLNLVNGTISVVGFD